MPAGADQKSVGPRLQAILDLLTPCERLADVGTDHGLVPVGAVASGRAGRAWGVDKQASPLAAAGLLVGKHGKGLVTLLEGDGLQPLADVAPDALVMAGMGADTMVGILDARPDVLAGVAQLVAQPNADVHLLRAWARARGWRLSHEALPVQRRRWYPTLRYVRGAPDAAYDVVGFSDAELERIGPLLLASGDPAVEAWLGTQARRLGLHGDPGAATFVRALAFVRGARVP